MKKLLSLLLAVCTTLSLTMTACAAQEGPEVVPLAAASQPLPFTDVPADAWYADEVQYCYEHGIFAGTSGATFSPDDVLTRAMLVTILYRAEGSPSLEEENLSYLFSDVPGDSWYADGVYWARLEGVVGGYGGNVFGPDDPVTREQAVTILWRQAGSPAASAGDFSDGDGIAAWAASAAGWALGTGLLTGWADDAFHPQAGLTRAEAAVLLARYQQSGTAGTEEGDRTLVAYFSATGTTRPLAEYAAEILNAGLYEIVPAEPYTAEDLDYGNSDSRTTREQNDPDARPAISGAVENMEQYDTVLLGYTEWIFPDPLRPERPTRPNAAYVHMKELLKRAGLPSIRFHDLRHPYVKHTTKKYNSEKQKTQATKIVDLIAWGFCFCIVSYSKRSWTL